MRCRSYFNDSIQLQHSDGTPVDGHSESGIAWESDVNVKFKNAPADGEVKTGSNFPLFYHERQQSCERFNRYAAAMSTFVVK